jgi:hypothetical protein
LEETRPAFWRTLSEADHALSGQTKSRLIAGTTSTGRSASRPSRSFGSDQEHTGSGHGPELELIPLDADGIGENPGSDSTCAIQRLM